MSRFKSNVVLLALIAGVCAAGSAFAASEQSNAAMGFPPGYLQINKTTCKFLHHEIDLPLGPTVAKLARAYSWDDARHDVKGACQSNKPDPDGTIIGYVQVTAHGAGPSVTAQCPAGDVVLGGGSPDETTGSYPSGVSAWTIRRDHLSPPTMTVTATCAIGGTLP